MAKHRRRRQLGSPQSDRIGIGIVVLAAAGAGVYLWQRSKKPVITSAQSVPPPITVPPIVQQAIANTPAAPSQATPPIAASYSYKRIGSDCMYVVTMSDGKTSASKASPAMCPSMA